MPSLFIFSHLKSSFKAVHISYQWPMPADRQSETHHHAEDKTEITLPSLCDPTLTIKQGGEEYPKLAVEIRR